MINTETNYRWFIFYQDQLLLEKNDNAFSIPTGKNAPVTIPEGITVHTITTATGYWDRSNRFCPTCGTPLVQKEPIMKKCPNCGREIYPVISTAILVLVRKEDSLLLVHARNFKGTFNSLVAGFLETGETLEECVAREVKEETGLDVKNIRYFGSQPWPYPSGLMVGFIADYAGGDIHLQDDELSSGNFYTRDHLPELPRKLSLARKMIDWWIAQQ